MVITFISIRLQPVSLVRASNADLLKCRVCREDVARLIVGALNNQDLVKFKSFDCVSKAPGEGSVTKDFMQLFTDQLK